VRRQAGEQGPALEAGSAGVAVKWLKVIEDPRSVEPDFLCEPDPLEQLRPLELVLGNV
jgi:hypothetical protein